MSSSSICREILKNTGFTLSNQQISDTRYIFRPEQFPVSEGFLFEVEGYSDRTVYSVYPENMARYSVEQMGNSDDVKFIFFVQNIENLVQFGDVIIEVGNTEVENDIHLLKSAHWHNFTIELKSELTLDFTNKQFNHATINILSLFNSALMSFFELEESHGFENKSTDFVDSEYGLPEGAKKVVTVNKYERSRKNRELCIAAYGTSCIVCGFSFGENYGDIGEGCIHVHHLIPVSQMGGEYVVNPIKDLVPVCPNCHWMLHRREPPYTPQELLDIMTSDEDSSE